MPILPPQPDHFPADLFGRDREAVAGGSIVPTTGPAAWLAFATRSRREKELIRCLRAAGIPHCCPLVTRQQRSPAGRVRRSQLPLFPGYVFACVDHDQRLAALKSNTISQTIPVADPLTLLTDLAAIDQLVNAGRPMTPEARIEPGERVCIRSGLLRGHEGTVIRRRGEDRLVLAVRFLNQGVSVELGDFDVEKLL